MTIKDATLQLVTALQLPDKETMQSLDRDINGQWYATQAVKGIKSDRETLRIHHLTVAGEYIDSMTFVDGGHGTSMYVRRSVGGNLKVGVDVDSYSGTTKHYDCVDVYWDSGAKYQGPVDAVAVHLTPGYSMPLLNRQNQCVVVRRTGHGEETYRQFHLADYLADRSSVQVGKTVGPIPNGSGTPTHQGAAAWGDNLYRLTGTAHADRLLTAYSLVTGKELWSKPLTTLGGTASYREPEGMFFDENGILYIGVTTKDSKGNYVHLVYALDPDDKSNPRSSVWRAWPITIGKYEGRCSWMYADTKNLVTTGTGNMIDTGKGLTLWGQVLGWQTAKKAYASESAIKAEYTKVKHAGIQKRGGYAYEAITSLRISDDVIDWAVRSKAMSNWKTTLKAFPDMATWPADAQMAFMCMCWWMGPFFSAGWPRLTEALKDQNFFAAAADCVTSARAPRDFDHQTWFTTAGKVAAAGLNPASLMGKDTPRVTVGANIFDAKSSVSASVVASAKPGVFNVDAWYVQRALAAVGTYKSPVDGLFGPVSNQAVKDAKVDLTNKGLNKLMQRSHLYLDVVG